MKARALRGVCVGVDRHLAIGETVDTAEVHLDASTVAFLTSIGAIEIVPEEPAPPVVAEPSAPEPEFDELPKTGKKEK